MIGHATAIPLGRGASAEVYRVFDEARGRWLAVKLLHRGDALARARLVREARALQQLDHPHICPVLEVGEHDGRPCLVMPLLPGLPLDAAVADLPLESRLRVLAQVARAVHHAHELGLLHRDLKPGNILVDATSGLPHAWVLDFGVVRDLGLPAATSDGELVGTPAYMSPEQARGQLDLDRRSDVFSLGILLYELLTGRHPFAAEGTAATLAAVANAQPLPPRRHRPTLPRSLEAIALRCLEARPDRRYGSARLLADDIDRFLRGDAVTATHGLATRMRRAAARRPRTVVATLAGLAVFAAIGGTWLLRSHAAAVQVQTAATLAAQAEAARQALGLVYMRPEHDVRPAIAEAEAATAALLARTQGQPAALRARALFAAGQVQLAAGNVDAARERLLAARALATFPELDRTLGLVNLRAYRQRLAEPALLSDPELQAADLRQAHDELLLPARSLLQTTGAQSTADDDLLVAAELAYAEGRIDDARDALSRAAAAAPWRYAARLVLAEVLLDRGRQAHWQGHRDRAVASLEQARAQLDDALDYGRSDPLLHRRRCEVAALRHEALGARAAADRADEDALSTCQRALRVQPASAPMHAALAQLLSLRARVERAAGTDPAATLQQAEQAARTAYELAPASAVSVRTYARVLMRASSTQRWAGRPDPERVEAAEQALAARLADVGSEVEDLYVAALVAAERAQVDEALGKSADAAFRRAVDLLDAAVARAPDAAFLRQHLAQVASALQLYLAQRGRPEPQLSRRAIVELEHVLARHPDRVVATSALADAHWDLVVVLAARGDDFSAEQARASALYRRALTEEPDNLSWRFNAWSFALVVADEQLRRDRDATAALAEAAGLLARMDAQRPDWVTPCPRAEQHLLEAEQAARQGDHAGARQALAVAERLLETALAEQPDDVDCARRRLRAYRGRALLAEPRQPPASWPADADALFARHAAVPQIQLAWLELAAVQLSRSPAQDVAELARTFRGRRDALAAATGDAWSARLRALDRALPGNAAVLANGLR